MKTCFPFKCALLSVSLYFLFAVFREDGDAYMDPGYFGFKFNV
jgi:hypothetical protein